jgi:hypothetical protein
VDDRDVAEMGKEDEVVDDEQITQHSRSVRVGKRKEEARVC